MGTRLSNTKCIRRDVLSAIPLAIHGTTRVTSFHEMSLAATLITPVNIAMPRGIRKKIPLQIRTFFTSLRKALQVAQDRLLRFLMAK